MSFYQSWKIHFYLKSNTHLIRDFAKEVNYSRKGGTPDSRKVDGREPSGDKHVTAIIGSRNGLNILQDLIALGQLLTYLCVKKSSALVNNQRWKMVWKII